MNITVDEWLYHYLIEENEEKQEIAEKFLNKIFEKCHSIVILKDSPVQEKIYKLSKIASQGKLSGKQIKIIKNFFGKFVTNSNKCQIIEEKIEELPDQIISFLPKKEKDKDKYLIKTCLVSDKIIVTTDRDLKNAINKKEDIRVYLVEEFLDLLDNNILL